MPSPSDACSDFAYSSFHTLTLHTAIKYQICTKSESHRLESLLNFACRTVLRRCKHSSASGARHDLGLSTLSSRRKLHLSQTVFKCLSSHCPSYLSQLFSGPNSSHHTQSYSSCQLNLPLTRSSFGQRSISSTGTSMWRSLPARRKISGLSLPSAKISSWTDLYVHAQS